MFGRTRPCLHGSIELASLWLFCCPQLSYRPLLKWARKDRSKARILTPPPPSRPGGISRKGRETFRFDTFGSEDFWGGKLKLHEAIAGEKLGGIGPGLSPEKALELGLKVDVNAIPEGCGRSARQG